MEAINNAELVSAVWFITFFLVAIVAGAWSARKS